jgi:hypothetical protein
LEEETHHFKVKTHLFLGKIDIYLSILKGGTPLDMFMEHRCFPFLVKGAPWFFVSHSRGAPFLLREKGDPPPYSMGQLSQDEVGYVQPPCYGFTLGYDTNLKEPYPQPYP